MMVKQREYNGTKLYQGDTSRSKGIPSELKK